MAAYLLVDIEVLDPEAYKEYLVKVPPLVKKHGGIYKARGGSPKALEGNWQPSRLVLLEFPNRESAEVFLNDPEYQPIRQIRLETTRSNMVLFDGV